MYKTIAIQTRSTYWSNKESNEELIVDSVDLAQEVEKICNKLETEGYEPILITPITSGSMSNGNGYYQTASILITAKKKE